MTSTPNPSPDSAAWEIDTSESAAQGMSLRDALALESGESDASIRKGVGLTVVALAIATAGAALVPIQNYVIASGEVEPAGDLVKVQHLEGGIIAALNVREGDAVRRNQVLMRVSDTILGSERDQIANKLTALRLESRELRGALGEPLPPSGALPSLPQQRLLSAFTYLRTARQQALVRQIEQIRRQIDTLDAKRREFMDEVALIRKQTQAYESLRSSGAISHSSILEAERRQAQTETQIAELDGRREELVSSIDELRTKAELETRERLAQVESQIAELTSSLEKSRDQVTRLEVRSPVDGLVESLAVRNVGGVLPPGAIAAEIVPTGDQLMVFGRVKPQDIGHVSKGQPVEIKVQAYDSGRFGTVRGQVESISPSTFKDERTEQPYYKVRISLAHPYVGQEPGRNPLVPGMTVTADILTDRTNLLSYLLAPIVRSASEALKTSG